MQRLKAIFIALLIAVGLTVFVVGSLRGAPPAPANRVVVQYWEKWTGDEGVAMQGIVNDFNNTVGKEKNIYVQWVNMSSIDQKTMVAIAAGVPPDIAGLWDNQLNHFAAMNALEPLDALAAEHGIGPQTYKPVFWNAVTSYQNHLWGLISTPAAVALHYNKQMFIDRADDLRKAGLDPNRLPQTIDELDRYAEALTTYDPSTSGPERRIICSGFQPMEPGWYVTQLPFFFGGDIFDKKTQKLQLTSDACVRAFDWVCSYSRKYGKDAISEFRSGTGNFQSSQNPFFIGHMAMEQQGPWMAHFAEDFAPELNRWHVPPEKVQREKDYAKLTDGMNKADVIALLGPGATDAGDGHSFTWDAGIKTIHATFDSADHLSQKSIEYIPAAERQAFTEWGAVPFPSAVPGLTNVGYVAYDVMVIPRGSQHKKEAFEFMAYVNRQDVMEKLCSLHCKNSPLQKVSENFIKYHPNPYIQVFQDSSDSPNAHATPSIPTWPEVSDELTVASQKCALLASTAKDALQAAADRCDQRWAYFQQIQATRAAQEKAQ